MPAPRNLRAVAEGDPGHRGPAALADVVAAPSIPPAEPVWEVLFPLDDLESRTCRAVCEHEWQGIVPLLDSMGLLCGALDVAVLQEYCVCMARIAQCERYISKRGLVIEGRVKGADVRNPAITAVAQYRTQLARLVQHLGLSPNARDGIHRAGPPAGGESSPWSS